MTAADHAAALLRFRVRQSSPVFCTGCGERTSDRRTRCDACRAGIVPPVPAVLRGRPSHPSRGYDRSYYERNRETVLAKNSARQRQKRADARAELHRCTNARVGATRRCRYLLPLERQLIRETWQRAEASGQPITKKELAIEYGVHGSTIIDVLRDIAPPRPTVRRSAWLKLGNRKPIPAPTDTATLERAA